MYESVSASFAAKTLYRIIERCCKYMAQVFLHDGRSQPLQFLGIHDLLLHVEPDAIHVERGKVEGVRAIDAVELVQLGVTAEWRSGHA